MTKKYFLRDRHNRKTVDELKALLKPMKAIKK